MVVWGSFQKQESRGFQRVLGLLGYDGLFGYETEAYREVKGNPTETRNCGQGMRLFLVGHPLTGRFKEGEGTILGVSLFRQPCKPQKAKGSPRLRGWDPGHSYGRLRVGSCACQIYFCLCVCVVVCLSFFLLILYCWGRHFDGFRGIKVSKWGCFPLTHHLG